METVRSTSQVSPVQGVKPYTNPTPTTSADSGGTEFDTTLKAILKGDSANMVSEEDVFSALVQERIKKTKGDEVLKKFQELLATTQTEMKKGDGFIPMEDAAKAALIKAREAGILTKEETDLIYSQSFAAAQLDDNKDVLFDNRGGGSDPTIAVADIAAAITASRALIEKFDSGEEKAATRSVDEVSTGKSAGMGSSGGAGGASGFLYKPVSDTTGKLVVLTPSKLAGLIQGVKLYDPAGKLIESGRYTGNGNGGRDHFRFTKPGSSYPDGMVVEVTLNTQDKVRYVINETSNRSENLTPQNNSGSGSTSGGTGSGSGSSAGTPRDL